MQSNEQRQLLRETFTQAAELYDRMRPTYPEAIFDELVSFGQLREGSRVLEIGCGTGQATSSLARRGFQVVAVELGADMALVARRKLAGFPNVEIEVSALEDWRLPAAPFEAVISATAFHWVDPEVRIPKVAAALRPGGTLAIISTHHIAGGDTELFAELQSCYEQWDPATPPGLRLEPASAIPTDSAEFDHSGRFERVEIRRFEWSATYSSLEYRDLLLTYSGHRALERSRQSGLLECITGLIDTRNGGHITKRYMNELLLTRLRP